MLVLWVAVTLALVLGRAAARRLAARVSAPERCMLVGAPGTMRAIEDKLAARRIHATVAAKVPLSEGSGVASLLEELPAMIRRAPRSDSPGVGTVYSW